MYFKDFSKKVLNVVGGKLRQWTAIKKEYYFRIQVLSVDTISRCFKETVEAIHKRTKYNFSLW